MTRGRPKEVAFVFDALAASFVGLPTWRMQRDDAAEQPDADGYARANRHKPSGIESKHSHFRTHLVGTLGEKRLDRIGDEDIQQLKAAIDGGNKTVNNV
jgi:hypothetical protein